MAQRNEDSSCRKHYDAGSDAEGEAVANEARLLPALQPAELCRAIFVKHSIIFG